MKVPAPHPSPEKPLYGQNLTGKLIQVAKIVGRVLRLISEEIGRGGGPARDKKRLLEFQRTHMPISTQTRAELLREYARLKSRKKESFEFTESLPTSTDSHTSVAILEAWLDGLISDDYLNAVMAAHGECESCQENYNFYRKLKDKQTDFQEP